MLNMICNTYIIGFQYRTMKYSLTIILCIILSDTIAIFAQPIAAAVQNQTKVQNQPYAVGNRTSIPVIPIPKSASGASLPSALGSAESIRQCKLNDVCRPWVVRYSGHTDFLDMISVDKQGRINGTLFGEPINDGFWDQISGRISFRVTIPRVENTSASF
jgi:hypothetical protein